MRAAVNNTRVLCLHHHNQSSHSPKKRLSLLQQSLNAIGSQRLFPGIEELWLDFPWAGLNGVSHSQRELFYEDVDKVMRSSISLSRLRFSDTREASCKGTIGMNFSPRQHCDSRKVYEICMSIIKSFMGLCLERYSEASSINDERGNDSWDLQRLLNRCSDWTPHITALKVGHSHCCVVPDILESTSLQCECGFCFRCRTDHCGCKTFASI